MQPAGVVQIRPAAIGDFIARLAHVVLPSAFALDATYRYGWSAAIVGLTLAMANP